jgi:hypothetical protein
MLAAFSIMKNPTSKDWIKASVRTPIEVCSYMTQRPAEAPRVIFFDRSHATIKEWAESNIEWQEVNTDPAL